MSVAKNYGKKSIKM